MSSSDSGHTDDVTDNRTPDNEQRRLWREAQRLYYQRHRERKLAAIARYREQHPERYQEIQNLARKRSRRGIQRTYRKSTNA